jgi:hypothetical protein
MAENEANDEEVDGAEPTADEGAAEAAATPPAARGPKRTPAFRAGLIGRLPTLSYTAWSVKDDFKIDAEWDGVIGLKADAVLGPLEPYSPDHRP